MYHWVFMKKIVVFAGNDCLFEREKYYYSLALTTGRLLAENGFTVVSGGGPGLMNEVMRGAYQAGGKTIAVCLEVAGRKHTEFATEKYFYQSLPQRQGKLLSYADAFLSLPGGIGTLYEIAAVLALKRKKEINKDLPLILLSDYFQKFQNLLGFMREEGFINNDLLNYYQIALNSQKAVDLLKKYFSSI